MKTKILLVLFIAYLGNACSSSSDEEIPDPTFLVSLSNTSILFDDLIVNTTSTKDVTISNTGNQTITISNITVPSGFSVNPTSTTISSGSNKTFTATFSPTEVKTYSGAITVSSNATNVPSNITISGKGTAEPATFLVSLSTSALAFDDLTINEMSTKNLIISNTGNQIIDISNITVPTGFSISATTATINPGTNVSLIITFSPTEVKSYTGSISITSNATNVPSNITINGNGIAVVANSTFTADIAPIINQGCNVTGCHNSATKASGLDLSTYALVKTAFGKTGSLSAIGRIESGNMPKNGSKLSQDKIDKLKNWIQNNFIQ